MGHYRNGKNYSGFTPNVLNKVDSLIEKIKQFYTKDEIGDISNLQAIKHGDVVTNINHLNYALSEKISNLDLIEYIYGVGSNEFNGGSLNDFQNAGVFLVKNSTDHPTDVSNSGKLIVIITNKTYSDYKTQIYFPNFSQPYTRYRYYRSGGWVWSQWLKIGS